MKPVLLDCTLRDGGYWNSWDFPPELVSAYLKAMDAIGIDYVELGFRSAVNDRFLGPFAFTTDTFLADLAIPSALKVAVMVNASELLSAQDGPLKVLGELFAPASMSRVSLVRIAARRADVDRLGPCFAWLRNQGYQSSLNLMQISTLDEADFPEVGRAASGVNPDILYLADSLGSLVPGQVPGLIRRVREGWTGPIGIHAHDNMGYALANTLAGAGHGATFLDATVLGMGRGPGNARTEHLILEVGDARNAFSELGPLAHLVSGYFRPLKVRYAWGTNLYYYLTGKYGIHPSYVQQMLSDSRFEDEDILEVLRYLKEVRAKSFDRVSIEAGRNFRAASNLGKWMPSEWVAGRDVLILGPGAGVARHRAALERYIRSGKPVVVALNTLRDVDPDLIDLRAVCHPIRILADRRTYRELPQPIVVPGSLLSDELWETLSGHRFLDFGVRVQENTFVFGQTECVIPSTLVLAYALAIATSGGARRIFLAGFDGYEPGDPRQGEVARLFACYLNHAEAVPLKAITNSTYDLPGCSVYGPF